MSSAAFGGVMESSGKGKMRADPTEHTPLLSSGAIQSSSHAENLSTTPELTSHRLRSRLKLVFFISLSFCIGLFIILALLAWSYATRAQEVSPDDVLKNALVFRGPDSVNVLNLTSTGEIWVSVDVRLGLDAGAIISVNGDLEQAGFLSSIWKTLGRWGIRRVDQISVILSTINITSADDASSTLASLTIPPLVVPLATNPPHDTSWLTKFSIPLLIRPSNDTSTLLAFLRDSWQHGSFNIYADVGMATIHGGSLNESGWRSMIRKEFIDMHTVIQISIPPLPGLPHPGHHIPLPSVSDLVTLKSFNILSEADHLALRACATIIDPAPPTFSFKSPSVPFTVALPSPNSSYPPTPVASVFTAPFTLSHPNITLDILGTVLPLTSEANPALSSFLTRYLSNQSNPIFISSPLAPNLTVEALFPAPNPPPRILRNVTIQDMKIKPGTTFLASGTIFVRIVLPKGIDIDLNVSRVLPDVLIFDGEVPNSIHIPPPPPLPDPLPERAFGHIRPDDWLAAKSVREESTEGEGATFSVTAKIVDVPLEVLSGRQKEFSNFISKVIFGSGGAIAGILGSAAVAANVHGLSSPRPDGGDIEFAGLPFRGSVPVGKKSMLSAAPIQVVF